MQLTGQLFLRNDADVLLEKRYEAKIHSENSGVQWQSLGLESVLKPSIGGVVHVF